MSFESQVNDAVAKLGGMGIKNAAAKIDGKVVTLTGNAPDMATKSKAMQWFNGQVETENTVNMIRIDQPVASAPAPSATASPSPSASAPAASSSDATRIPSSTPGPVTAATQRTHVVEHGDTLSAIAKKYYGKPNDYMKIFEANKDVLKDPNKIYPGQKLLIP